VLFAIFGGIPWNSAMMKWIAPLGSAAFLALTGVILILDLEHPERFYLIFTKHQWRSWLVRGAFIIGAYSLVLLLHLAASFSGAIVVQQWLAIAGIPLAIMTAVYTGYLFAQSKARDLWQNPLLPPHLFVQALLAGSAVVSGIAIALNLPSRDALLWLLAASALTHLLFVLGELTLGHPTAHAHLALQEMVAGKYAKPFWFAAGFVFVAIFAPWLTWLAIALALLGLYCYEHAYVQAGQAVPLA